MFHVCCSKRPVKLNCAACGWSTEAIFNKCFWTGYSHCAGGSYCPPKLLVHCVAASILPITTRPHEQKLQLALSHCGVPGGRVRVFMEWGSELLGPLTSERAAASKLKNCPERAGIVGRHLPSAHSAKKLNGVEVGRLQLNWICCQWKCFDVAKIKQLL